MSLANPLGKSAFADLLRVASTRFTLGFNQERSLSGGGDVLYADLAPALWQADIVTVAMEHSEAKGLIALINSRHGGVGTFLLYDHSLPYPSSDDDGAIWTGASPTALVGVVTDRYHLAFTGFPNSYVIPLGTYFEITYGSTRKYLGQFCEPKTSHASTGAVTAVEVTPELPASVATGAAVTLMKPSGKFKIMPGTAFAQSISTVHSTVAFSAEQTLAP